VSFLYRSALVITRLPPYNDWAIRQDGAGAELQAHLEQDRRTVYLGPEVNDRPSLEALVEDLWQDIFKMELESWVQDPAAWPAPLTRDLFNEWFDVDLIDTVVDLVPEEPLTQAEIDAEDLDYALHHCGWCGLDLGPDGSRAVGFTLPNRELFAFFEGRVLHVPARDGEAIPGIMSRGGSEAAAAEQDLLFRACSSRCEKLIRKHVPRGLQRVQQQIERATRG